MFGYDLVEINKDNIKIGDVVGVARSIQIDWGIYKHPEIRAVKINKITPKRTKFVSDDGTEFISKYTTFFELNEEAKRETELALAMKKFCNAYADVENYRRGEGFRHIPDEKIEKLSELMSEIAEILNREERENDN